MRILLCTDLDRTVLPNGPDEESPQARPLFRAIAARPEITLSYVTGRDKPLVLEAISEYQLPTPDYAITDVGTTIYEVRKGKWHRWQEWDQEISPDWSDMTRDDLAGVLGDLDGLRLQELGKQGRFKLSYYTPANVDLRSLLQEMRERLATRRVRASLIWSLDEAAAVGLLDVLPERATKLHGIRFLMRRERFDRAYTVFAGDSGNDLPALTSGLQAVLVRNARDDVRRDAIAGLAGRGMTDRLYLAQGGFLGMNGNYAAGVLEGLAHFVPEAAQWMSLASH
jgi:HAD superfamily hydrolase (TIGR01484 family)